MKMSNKTYDTLKKFALYILPVLNTLFVTLNGTFDIPYGDVAIGVLVVVDAALGAFLKFANDQYNKQQESDLPNYDEENKEKEDGE